MWRELTRNAMIAEVAPGATAAQLDVAESELGFGLPNELRDLLRETDGVVGEYGVNLIWPWRRIVDDNHAFRLNDDFRQLYMPFESLLFFGDAGNGDQFAFIVLGGQVRKQDIFAWNHENDSRTWVAPDLHRFIEWWGSGRISP